MKVIILAAGRGSRLMPLTKNSPKCMVKLLGKPIVEHQIEILRNNNLTEINIITGYMENKINLDNINKIHNPKYDSTNMVYSLFCGDKVLENDDILIIYGDIVFNDNIIKQIIKCDSKISIIVDNNWKEYWSARMNNPLHDAETLKLDKNGNITELGKKPESYDEINGQYIGMIKIKKNFLTDFKNFYRSLDRNKYYDNQDFNNMYMTSFLDLITKKLYPIKPIFVNNGWIEIDTPEDLKHYNFLYK